MKFVGAGEGAKALIAELLAGEIGRALGLDVPEIVLLNMSPLLGPGRSRIRDRSLLQASVGLNLARATCPCLCLQPPAPLQARPDVGIGPSGRRLCDQRGSVRPQCQPAGVGKQALAHRPRGRVFYFHHDWNDYLARSQTPFTLIRQHTLLPFASQLESADAELRPRLDATVLAAIVDAIPAVWLANEPGFADESAHRAAYLAYLTHRLAAAPIFLEEAVRARSLRL